MWQSVQENMNCGLSLQKLLLSQQNHRQLLLSHHQGAGVGGSSSTLETLLEQNRRLQHPSPLDTLLEHSYASGFRTHQVPYRKGAMPRHFFSLSRLLFARCPNLGVMIRCFQVFFFTTDLPRYPIRYHAGVLVQGFVYSRSCTSAVKSLKFRTVP
jgi:hypothetical protein